MDCHDKKCRFNRDQIENTNSKRTLIHAVAQPTTNKANRQVLLSLTTLLGGTCSLSSRRITLEIGHNRISTLRIKVEHIKVLKISPFSILSINKTKTSTASLKHGLLAKIRIRYNNKTEQTKAQLKDIHGNIDSTTRAEKVEASTVVG